MGQASPEALSSSARARSPPTYLSGSSVAEGSVSEELLYRALPIRPRPVFANCDPIGYAESPRWQRRFVHKLPGLESRPVPGLRNRNIGPTTRFTDDDVCNAELGRNFFGSDQTSS